MDVVVASHPSALLHDTGPRHPERPERVGAVLSGIDESGLVIKRLTAPLAEPDDLALVHAQSYIEMIHTFCELGGGALDMDTFASRTSWDAALRAVGGVAALAEELEAHESATGFAVTRPPGHHAMPDRAMGFCLFNNVGVAVARLRKQGKRVAVLDWDVHHGNGTQEMFRDDDGTLYVSIHQSNFYPFTGRVGDIELGEARGTTVNVPLPAGTAGDVYRRAWGELVIPVVTQFEPDWVVVSAGFDAHVNDHLAQFQLMADDFGWMASELARAHPPRRTIVVLEGGYDIDALRESTAATLRGLAQEWVGTSLPMTSPPRADAALRDAMTAVRRHWRL